jgi:hypothetical protein
MDDNDSPSRPAMDLTFISLLRAISKERCRVRFEQPKGMHCMHRRPRPVIERGCSIGANHAQNCQPMSSGLTTRVAIARFRIIRARFNKRSTQAFPKADRRSNIRNVPLCGSIYRRDLLRLLGSGRFA